MGLYLGAIYLISNLLYKFEFTYVTTEYTQIKNFAHFQRCFCSHLPFLC